METVPRFMLADSPVQSNLELASGWKTSAAASGLLAAPTSTLVSLSLHLFWIRRLSCCRHEGPTHAWALHPGIVGHRFVQRGLRCMQQGFKRQAGVRLLSAAATWQRGVTA